MDKADLLEAITKGGLIELPTLPSLAIKILDAVRDDSSFDVLVNLIKQDPCLATKVLAVANSPLFSRGIEIRDLSRAIALLGTEMVKNIALSFAFIRVFQKGTERTGAFKAGAFFDLAYFWKRSLTSAVAAELLSRSMGFKSSTLYLQGLLMDIGIMVMFWCRPEDYERVLNLKCAENLSILRAEKKIFGFTHQEVGGAVLSYWGLPEVFVVSAQKHHDVAEDTEKTDLKILNISDKMAGVYFSLTPYEKYSYVISQTEKILGISSFTVEEILDRLAVEARRAIRLFDLPVEKIKPYSQILEEANRELQKLNVECAHLLQQLKEEKVRAEKLAKQLKEANERLFEMAIKDPLTGVYNRRYFQEKLNEEFARFKRYGGRFSIIVIDVDHFKKINDTYGHLFGDEVLRTLGKIFQEEVRKTDFVARYGGEEFVLLLPSTSVEGACFLARRIKEKVENYPFVYEAEGERRRVKVTVSIGIAGVNGNTFFCNPDDVLKMADKALYVSKLKGRNRITVIR